MGQEQQVKRRLIDAKVENTSTEEVAIPDLSRALGQIDNIKEGKVKVRHGVNSGDFEVGGQTVAYIRENLETLYGIDKTAVAYINGEEVTDENATVLNAGSDLDFIKESGSKGS